MAASAHLLILVATTTTTATTKKPPPSTLNYLRPVNDDLFGGQSVLCVLPSGPLYLSLSLSLTALHWFRMKGPTQFSSSAHQLHQRTWCPPTNGHHLLCVYLVRAARFELRLSEWTPDIFDICRRRSSVSAVSAVSGQRWKPSSDDDDGDGIGDALHLGLQAQAQDVPAIDCAINYYHACMHSLTHSLAHCNWCNIIGCKLNYF